jgi:hypothetical protein
MGSAGAGGGEEAGRGLLVQALALFPVELGGEEGGQVEGLDLVEAALAGQPGAEPGFQTLLKLGGRQVWPAGIGFQGAHQEDPGL